MFDSPLGHCRRPPAVLALTSILAAASLVAAPAHGFGLSGKQFVEGLGKVGDAVKSAQEAERHGRSDTEQFAVDKAGAIADKATDAIGQASIKLSRKAWDALKKSDSKRVGELAKKTAKRWGPAAMKGLRLAGPTGRVVDTAVAGYTVGSAIGENVVAPLIDRYFDGKSRELEEQIRSDMKEIRKRGEFSRRLDEDIAAYQREARVMEEEERALYRPDGSEDTSDPWGDDESDATRDSLVPVASNVPDPWGQDDAASGEQPWSDQKSQQDWTADDEGVDAYAAALANVFDESTEHEAKEDDYNNALATLDRREAEARRAAEAERLRVEREAERARQHAAREAERARQRAAREAERAQAAAAAARREEREAWVQLGTTIAQGVVALSAARQGYTESSGLPSIPSFPESTPAPSFGSGWDSGARSSNCEVDMTSICRQVKTTMESRMAANRARQNAGGLSMSQMLDLTAEMYKVVLDHAPTCFATETRPHCMAANQRYLEEMRRAYQSALESARQARGGL